jgi:hypothetical protein
MNGLILTREDEKSKTKVKAASKAAFTVPSPSENFGTAAF